MYQSNVYFYTLLFTYVSVSSYCYVVPGPLYPPTKGAVWPKPQQQTKSGITKFVDVGAFKFVLSNKKNTCNILSRAIQHYKKYLNSMGTRPRHMAQQHSKDLNNTLNQATIDLTKPCNDNGLPYFGMDENYTLTVTNEIYIKSNSVWGILRGLETMLQLLYTEKQGSTKHHVLNQTTIKDWPAYAHRGLLIDTSRHYISVANILKTLKAMAINKMNVLHWHIVDDQSFPYQSEIFPELSDKGAYDESMIYSKANIQKVIGYARDRGIRVVPEFDVPGHTRSWGVAYPNILTECYEYNKVVALGPLNPIKTETYKLLRELFRESQVWFPDKFFHVGGDEVEMNCWASNPELLEFMNNNNMTSPKQLHALFMKRAIPLLKNDSIPIVWQEVYEEGVTLNKETLVQVWKNFGTPASFLMEKILEDGHRVLFSASWYLDHLSTGGDWEKYYKVDPRSMITNATLTEGIVGGEACMWGETVDDRNIISRVWPRASAVAERLWSGADRTADGYNYYPYLLTIHGYSNTDMTEVRRRLEEHTCRMIRRGINAQPPSGPGFCIV